MLKRFRQIVMGFLLALALSVLVSGPAQAYVCACYCNPLQPNQCTTYTVDLLPNATWCGANPSPGQYDILIYTGTNYAAGSASSATQPLCQRIHLPGGEAVSDLSTYDLNGPSYHIQSVWLGANTTAAFYSGIGGSGSSHGLYYNSTYYENDMHAHWGWYPASVIMNRM